MVVFLVIIIALGWFFGFYYNNPVILYGAVIFSVVMNLISYWNSDKIVLKISGARPANRDEHFDLYTSVENLAITAGLPMPKVYIIEDSVPNAFATGRDKDHAAVAFTTGLLQILDKAELEGVVAHELAHIGNRDILLQTVVVILVGFIALLSDLFMRSMFFGGNGNNKNGGGWIVLIGIVLAILSPLVATLIQLAISRKREFLADATGALLTRYPKGLASALQKITQHSGKMKRANHAMAHMYISDPYGAKEKKVSFFHKMFLTHPPAQERISALLGSK